MGRVLDRNGFQALVDSAALAFFSTHQLVPLPMGAAVPVIVPAPTAWHLRKR